MWLYEDPPRKDDRLWRCTAVLNVRANWTHTADATEVEHEANKPALNTPKLKLRWSLNLRRRQLEKQALRANADQLKLAVVMIGE
jgi:hypothetical protein